jgi:hypothetical protein
MSPFLYYLKHASQLSTLASKGKTDTSHIAVELLTAMAPTLKKSFPFLAEDDLLDDTISTLAGILNA